MALVLKDLMTIQRQLKAQSFFLIIILFIAAFMQQGPILFAFITFIAATQAITALTYDELCNWDKFANTLPITKSDIVLSKYLLGIALMLIGLTIALPFAFLISYIADKGETINFFLTFSLIVTAAFCLLALLLPIYIKFGSVKGRMVLIAACFVPGFLVGLLEDHIAQFLPKFLELQNLSFFAPIAGLVILWLSSLISTAIYEKKDF
ncbi:ABC-2 transporter permease [Lysinibacillus sp. NPDC096418]|uniref:ABC-2 transporter permease n=1 Tax=Lysinibacillus sp. NPDC096418 TaxID=3364138 RepID=UPI0038008F94